MATEHTAKAFDSDLQELTRLVAEMGGLAERMITDSVDALVRRDVALSRRVVAADVEIDALQRTIEERSVLTIARRQPMAVDLREIVSAMRVAIDLERIGDLAKNIGKRVIALDGDLGMPRRALRGVNHMLTLALGLFRDALDCFAERDSNKALRIRNRDTEVDQIYTSLFRELVVHMMEDPGLIAFGLHLLFCVKNLERVGDHAVSIADSIYYVVEGRALSAATVPDKPGSEPVAAPALAAQPVV